MIGVARGGNVTVQGRPRSAGTSMPLIGALPAAGPTREKAPSGASVGASAWQRWAPIPKLPARAARVSCAIVLWF